VACSRAKEHPLFPVNNQVWHGSEWGDESPVFLHMLDVIVRVGGGKQSLAEVAWMKTRGFPVIEHELQAFA
jgi:hypothetical protein